MPGRRVFDREKEDEVLSQYATGVSANSLAKSNGVSINAILGLLRRRHVQVRYRNYYRIKRRSVISLCPDVSAKAYVAGLVDGEGTITLVNGHHVAVSIANTDTRLLHFVERTFGGKVVGMRPNPSRFSKKPIFQWKIQSLIDVKTFLEQVEPYLIQKREKAIAVISTCREVLSCS